MAKERQTPGPKAVAIPSDRAWIDPPLVAVIQEVVVSQVVVGLAAATSICQASIRRWSLFVTPQTPGAGFQIAPWPDVDQFAWSANNLTTPIGPLKLWDIGTIVGNQWWAFSMAGCTLRVVEVLRKG